MILKDFVRDYRQLLVSLIVSVNPQATTTEADLMRHVRLDRQVRKMALDMGVIDIMSLDFFVNTFREKLLHMVYDKYCLQHPTPEELKKVVAADPELQKIAIGLGVVFPE